MPLATLSKHGKSLQRHGWLPSNFPEIVNVRYATDADNISDAYAFVADDYDGSGVVALKPEDFEFITP